MASAASCSFSFGDTPEGVAEELIETELASSLGIEDVMADCEAPPNRDPGPTFACTSETDLGNIAWEAVMEDENTVNVNSVNLLAPSDVDVLESSAAEVLGAEAGIGLTADGFDCGDAAIVLGDDLTVACAVTDPASGDIYDATIEITDLETGTFNVEVADQPR